MYSQMKTLACRFKSSYQGIFIQVGKLLQGIKRTTEEKMEKISQKINSLAGQVSRQAKEERKKLKKQKEELEQELREYNVRTIMNVAINTADQSHYPCLHCARSTVEMSGDFIIS